MLAALQPGIAEPLLAARGTWVKKTAATAIQIWEVPVRKIVNNMI
jgi:hypothetical protein